MFSKSFASNGRMVVNNELERIWKEVFVACFKVLSYDLSGDNDESQGSLHE